VASDRRAFLMRVSPEVLACVERLAGAELRSVNAQVEVLLREALSRRGMWRDERNPPPPEGSDRGDAGL